MENEREPASVIPDARFTSNEEHTCSMLECRHFVAPCGLDGSHPVSQIGERYLDDAQNYKELGYCQRPPRPILGSSYGNDTCMYLFVRGPGGCR
jgi:hypothetical protein